MDFTGNCVIRFFNVTYVIKLITPHFNDMWSFSIWNKMQILVFKLIELLKKSYLFLICKIYIVFVNKNNVFCRLTKHYFRRAKTKWTMCSRTICTPFAYLLIFYRDNKIKNIHLIQAQILLMLLFDILQWKPYLFVYNKILSNIL